MRQLMIVAVFAVLGAWPVMASAQSSPAPFDCPWTAEADPTPSTGGDYGGDPP